MIFFSRHFCLPFYIHASVEYYKLEKWWYESQCSSPPALQKRFCSFKYFCSPYMSRKSSPNACCRHMRFSRKYLFNVLHLQLACTCLHLVLLLLQWNGKDFALFKIRVNNCSHIRNKCYCIEEILHVTLNKNLKYEE